MHSWFRKEVGKKVKEKTQKMFFLRGKNVGKQQPSSCVKKSEKKSGNEKKRWEKGGEKIKKKLFHQVSQKIVPHIFFLVEGLSGTAEEDSGAHLT